MTRILNAVLVSIEEIAIWICKVVGFLSLICILKTFIIASKNLQDYYGLLFLTDLAKDM